MTPGSRIVRPGSWPKRLGWLLLGAYLLYALGHIAMIVASQQSI